MFIIHSMTKYLFSVVAHLCIIAINGLIYSLRFINTVEEHWSFVCSTPPVLAIACKLIAWSVGYFSLPRKKKESFFFSEY